MLKEIQTTIERVFADYSVSVHVENEYVDSRETLIALLASDIFKTVAVGQNKPSARNRKKSTQPEPLPDGASQIKVYA